MPLSHTCTDGATGNSDHLDQILSDLGTESRRLAERAPAEQDFERFEGELHELFAAAERALLAHELEQLDPPVTIQALSVRAAWRRSCRRHPQVRVAVGMASAP